MEAFKYEITNSKGMKAELTDFGATIISLFVPDKYGDFRDVILGYEKIATYEKEGGYLGATVGRYANRISDAKINIDGVVTRLKRMIMRIIFTVDPVERLNCFGQSKITQNV